MSLHSVQSFLSLHAPDIAVIELPNSTATVALAATAHDVLPGQIAKTLSLRTAEGIMLVVMRGDSRLDNKKFKTRFGFKAKMLDATEVEAATTHPVGGVCPFGVPDNVTIYCDIALQDFTEVMPAGGATNAAVRVCPQRMASLVGAQWIDVAQHT